MEIILFISITLIIILFIYRPTQIKEIDSNNANITINQQKLKELKQDLTQGLITKENYIQAKLEIEQTLANELDATIINKSYNKHLVAGLIVIFMVISSYFIYDKVRNKQPEKTLINPIEKLINHLAKNPKDKEAWQMLGLSYSFKNQILEAKNAYAKSYKLGNKNIDFLTEYASILATLNNNNFTNLASDLVKEALEIDKNSVKALYLAGIIAANNNIFDLAKKLWEKALSLSKESDKYHQLLLNVLQQLANFINNNQQTAQISIVVEIDENFYKDHFDDYIMIYAKNAIGRPMPIAIEKIALRDFIGIITLSDENSLMQTNKLSTAKNIIIVARISKTGNAFKQKGDIEVKSKSIKIDNQTILLKI